LDSLNQKKLEKINVTEIAVEHWRYILYESDTKDLYIDVSYSPVSFVDASMLIKLNEEEKQNHLNDSDFLKKLSEKISYYFKDYLRRSLDRSNFNFT
jgi:hypothetical protein